MEHFRREILKRFRSNILQKICPWLCAADTYLTGKISLKNRWLYLQSETNVFTATTLFQTSV